MDKLSIKAAHEGLVTKKFSAGELVSYYFDRIEKRNPEINAILALNKHAAGEAAAKVDAKIHAGQEIGLLEGIPYIAKDMFNTKGLATTAASNILKPYVAPYNATVIDRLNAAGAILLGKANQDAFAHGSSNENSDFGPVKNPVDESRVPGGSSGGSAAVVADDWCVFALGTDTGGSIRLPASFTGIVGLKPTYGAVSRYGVIAMASSLDCPGPMTRSVEDAAIVLGAIAVQDAHDATTIDLKNYDFSSQLSGSLKGKTVGFIKEFFEGLDPQIAAVTKQALTVLEDAGATVKEVSIPQIKLALPCYYIICPAEVSSNLSRYDGVRYGLTAEDTKNLAETYVKSRSEGFGDEAKRRILTGTYVLSSGYYDAYYKKAQAVRTILIDEFAAAFDGIDFLAGPTATSGAFPLGEKSDDPLEMYLADIMTVAMNLVGVPAISVPAGHVDDLPIGLQLIAPQKCDGELLNAAYSFAKQREAL